MLSFIHPTDHSICLLHEDDDGRVGLVLVNSEAEGRAVAAWLRAQKQMHFNLYRLDAPAGETDQSQLQRAGYDWYFLASIEGDELVFTPNPVPQAA